MSLISGTSTPVNRHVPALKLDRLLKLIFKPMNRAV
jgi:hypothetical protein